MRLTKEQRQTAAIIAKFKTGATLTPAERHRLEQDRQAIADAETDRFLVETLAVSDAHAQPTRRYTRDSQEVLRAKSDFRIFGNPIPQSGSDAERKAGERQRAKMEAAGLIQVVRLKNRAIGFRLTYPADERARALAGRPGLRECAAVMKHLYDLIAAGKCSEPSKIDGTRFVSELALAGLDEHDEAGQWREKVYANELALLPASYRRWLRSCVIESPDGGGVSWSLTALGEIFTILPPEQVKLPKRVPKLVKLYEEVFAAHAFPRGFSDEELAAKLANERRIAEWLAREEAAGRRKPEENSKWPSPKIMAEAREQFAKTKNAATAATRSST